MKNWIIGNIRKRITSGFVSLPAIMLVPEIFAATRVGGNRQFPTVVQYSEPKSDGDFKTF
jgi:hypothetical protein